MNLFKQDIEETVHSTATLVFFTPASANEEKKLALYEQTVICNTASYAGKVTLPNVTEAKGMTYNIQLKTAGNNLTVQDRDDSEDWTDATLDAANDNMCVLSDGVRWSILCLDEN